MTRAQVKGLAVGLVTWALIASAIALVTVRIVVARVPSYSDDIRAWVERETRLRFQFDSLDARLRWYGPEVVLENARLLEPDGDQALITAREALIALDVWNLFRTGELVAGRLKFVGPKLTVVRLPDGRVRLLGQSERPADRPPFDLDRLPAGRVAIVDADVRFRDLMTGRGPWRLQELDLQLERIHGAVRASGAARLPSAMGSTVEFDGDIAGTLMQPNTLRGSIDADVEEADLPGWTGMLPPHVARIVRGHGDFHATVAFAGGGLRELKLDVATDNLALRLPARVVPGIETAVLTRHEPARSSRAFRLAAVEKSFVVRPAAPIPSVVSYQRLAARLRLRKDGAGWAFRAAELEVVPSSGRGSGRVVRGDVSGRFSGSLRTIFSAQLDARDLHLQDLWPVALAFAPPAADAWLGSNPRGNVNSLSLDIVRERAGAIPRFRVSADIAELSTSPSGRYPGVRGLTATLSGTDERGRIALRARQPALEWPRMFRDRLTVDDLRCDADWHREDRTWILSGNSVQIERPDLKVKGDFDLRFVSRNVSPELRFDADARLTDASIVPRFLPIGRLKPRSLGWLDGAFAGGSASGHITYRGPVQKFPFRHGEGDFAATAQVHDVTLNYFPGFAPLTGGNGTVTFHNGGLEGELSSGRVGQLALTAAKIRIEDLRAAVIDVHGEANGDVGAALDYLKASPLGPKLGKLFAQLTGRGPADYSVALSLPTQSIEDRDYSVQTRFRSAVLGIPALRAPVEDVTGTFTLHNYAASATDLRGRFLDGPFEASVSPDPAAANGSVGVNVRATGRLSGQGLPAFIGLPDTIEMRGTTAWTLALRSSRRATDDDWFTRIGVASNLSGLMIDAPHPFAKSAAETRDTRVRIDLGAGSRNDVEVQSGAARVQLAFVGRDEHWQLDRGIARFDGGPMPATLKPGLQVLGDWPEFDLGEWLTLRGSSSGRSGLADWLSQIDVQIDRAHVFGFELRDVHARMSDDGTSWLADLACPMIQGRVSVPLESTRERPIVLDLRRLQLQSAVSRRAPAAGVERPADPRQWSALQADIDEFSWNGRHFGRLTADVRHDADGLRLESLRTESPVLSLKGTGSWLAEGDGTRTRLDLEFDSTDLAAAARDLGYRQAIESERAHAKALVSWPGGPAEDVLQRMAGTVQVELGRGRVRNVEPGAAGRVLGLTSITELPRRLALDFRDVTDEGLAFDSVRGDFELRDGNAYTQNMLLKGAAVDIGIAGRTGLVTQDYDQTVVVSGNPSGALTVAGALAAGPVIGAGVLVLSQLFKGQLQGLTRAYYRVTGPWSDPIVQRVSAAANEGLAAQAPSETSP